MATKPLFPKLTLLHNPRCSKSRAAKQLLDEKGIEFTERLYLEEPLTPAELKELAKLLGRPASEWVRRGESAYKDAGLGANSDDAQILAAMGRHPILIERPILIAGDRAIVGRPPENVLKLLQ